MAAITKLETVRSQALSQTSELISLGEKIMLGDLTMNCRLMPAEDCNRLLEATAEQPAASPDDAVSLAEMLMGNYRKADFDNPKIFAASLAANFAAYPLSIGRQVIDPMKGIPSRLKFPPAVSEVREALANALAYRRAIAYRARWHLEQRANRGLDVKSPPIEAERAAADADTPPNPPHRV